MDAGRRIAVRRAGAGIGILVVLIAIVIIMVMMVASPNGGGAGGGGGYLNQVGAAKKSGERVAVTLDRQQLGMLISTYRQNNGKLPRTMADIEAPPSMAVDGWGNTITFTFEQDRRTGATKVTYRSAGEDGVPNTEDDVLTIDTLQF